MSSNFSVVVVKVTAIHIFYTCCKNSYFAGNELALHTTRGSSSCVLYDVKLCTIASESSNLSIYGHACSLQFCELFLFFILDLCMEIRIDRHIQ